MSHFRRLDSASGIFFLLGAVNNKLRNIPIPLVSLIFNTISLGFTLIGYILWTASCMLAPKERRKKEAWYGFSQYKHQNRLAGIIGVIGIALFFVGIAVPVIIPVAYWLIFISNAYWAIAEFHKLRSPPQNEPGYTKKNQNHYYNYALLITLASLISAIGYTAAAAVPPFFLPIFIVTTTIALFFSAIAIGELGAYFLSGCSLTNNAKMHQSLMAVSQECSASSLLPIGEKGSDRW